MAAANQFSSPAQTGVMFSCGLMVDSVSEEQEIIYVFTSAVLVIIDTKKVQRKLLFRLPADMGVGRSFLRALTFLLVAGGGHLGQHW